MKRTDQDLSIEIQVWLKLYDHLARLKHLLSVYLKLKDYFEKSQYQFHRYNSFLAPLYDSFSRNILVTLCIFIETRKDVWSLNKLPGVTEEKVSEMRSKSKKFLVLKNQITTHLSTKADTDYIWLILVLSDIAEIKVIAEEIETILKSVSISQNYRLSHSSSWVGIESSTNRFISDLSTHLPTSVALK